MDEMPIGAFWATLRADPWTRKTLETGLNPRLSAEALNALQKYAMENTRLGIPIFFAEECMHGHMAIGTTVFPTSIGQASTWNRTLIEKMGAAIAHETRSQGAHIAYGPVLDLAREPRWSRVCARIAGQGFRRWPPHLFHAQTFGGVWHSGGWAQRKAGANRCARIDRRTSSAV